MAQDTTEHPNTLTLRINAAADYVIDWLVRHTQDAPKWRTAAQPGKRGLALSNGQRMRYMDGPLVRLTGWSISPERGDANQTLHDLGDVLAFKVRALSADRCEVIVRSALPAVDAYLAPVLERMAVSYPECRPAIDQHLARSGEASPAVDQVKTPAKRGPKDRPEYQRAYDKLQSGEAEERVFAEYCAELRTPNPPQNFTSAFWRAMTRKGYKRKPKGPRAY